MNDIELRKLIVKIAIYYYIDNMNQIQIAKKLDISRPMVSRYLQKAKDLGIVNIHINDQNYHIAQMETKIEEEFGIEKAIITPTLELSEEETLLSVVRSSINYLKEQFQEHHNIGISWGNTLRILAREFPYESFNHLNFVPLIGGMGNQYIPYHSNQICYDLMNKFQCNSNFFYGPALIKDKTLMKTLKENDTIKEVMNRGKNVDMALIGISTPYINNIMKEVKYLTDDNLAEIKQLHGIGDLNSRIFDKDGNEIDCVINRSVLGLSLEDIKSIPHVVAISSGNEKKEAILTALQSGVIDVIITDEQVGKYLVDAK